MNMNMLMQQAQKMQKEMEKAQKELEEKVFEIKKYCQSKHQAFGCQGYFNYGLSTTISKFNRMF